MARLERVADGIYRDTITGKLKHRPIINGRRTWRNFTATTITKARVELAALKMAQLNARLHGGADPYADPVYISELAKKWKKLDCPDRKDIPRTGESLKAEKAKLDRLLPFWKYKSAELITIRDAKKYYHWRIKQSKKFRLARSVDTELNTLSNLLDWAVSEELIRANVLASKRPRFDDPEKVRHCPEVMPTTDEVFHQYAAWLLASHRSAPLGWQLLIEGLTGCRTSEILACRMDAKPLPNGLGEPGYYDGARFHVKRLKKGIKPFCPVETIPGHAPLKDCLAAFFNWHRKRYKNSKSPWFIPGVTPSNPQDRCSLTHALRRIHNLLKDDPEKKLPLITSHGLRAYFVKAMRSLGVVDQEIAARLGHRSTDQIEHTYGEVESDWFGKKKMDFLPQTGNPAWHPWLPAQSPNIIPYPKSGPLPQKHGIFVVSSENSDGTKPSKTNVNPK